MYHPVIKKGVIEGAQTGATYMLRELEDVNTDLLPNFKSENELES